MTEHEEKYWTLGMRTLYLTGCALNGQTPEPDIVPDRQALFDFCRFHSMAAMVAAALESSMRSWPEEEARKWSQVKDKTLRKNILLNAEREQILGYLNSIGCWHMPLKGSLLQHDYPRIDMRQMTDVDILIDPAFRDEIHDYMESRGYRTELFHQSAVDVYQKEPVYNFEFHTELFSHNTGATLEAYSRKLIAKLCSGRQGSLSRRLSDEDFYVYMMAHAAKHRKNQGVGIRILADMYVYLHRHGAGMDWAYVDGELEKLCIGDFEAMCRALSEKLFSRPSLQPDLEEGEQAFLMELFSSGTFGTESQQFQKKVQSGTGRITLWSRLRYILRRLFPTLDELQYDYPDIRENKWKIPFIFVKRVCKAIFCSPAKIFRELVRLFKTK